MRGLHFTVGRGAGKLVRCSVARSTTCSLTCAAARRPTASARATTSTTRSCESSTRPPGSAHGFCVVSEVADVVYKLDAYYDPATEREISHTDPALGVVWPVPASELVVSQRDLDAPALADVAAGLPFDYTG